MIKCHRSIFHLSDNEAGLPFSFVHSDVWRPTSISTHNRMKWFVTFVDDCTRMTWVYQLKHKNDVYTVFHLFHQMVATQFGTSIKVLHSDKGVILQARIDGVHAFGGFYSSNSLCLFPSTNGVTQQKK